MLQHSQEESAGAASSPIVCRASGGGRLSRMAGGPCGSCTPGRAIRVPRYAAQGAVRTSGSSAHSRGNGAQSRTRLSDAGRCPVPAGGGHHRDDFPRPIRPSGTGPWAGRRILPGQCSSRGGSGLASRYGSGPPSRHTAAGRAGALRSVIGASAGGSGRAMAGILGRPGDGQTDADSHSLHPCAVVGSANDNRTQSQVRQLRRANPLVEP